jgi:NodT family efflux transporter outer membrane factor (OMF) lipoprotein
LRETEASVPMARAELEALHNQATLLRNRLGMLAGADPAMGETIAAPTLKLDSGLMLPARLEADLVSHRPEIVAQRLRLEAATGDIDAAHAAFYPNIDLIVSGGLGVLDVGDLLKAGNQVFGLGLALHLPVFDAGRLRAGLALRNADYDAEVALYNKLVLDAFRDVADQVGSWRSLETQQQEHARAAFALDAASHAAEGRYREGLSDYLVVLRVQDRSLTQQRADADLNASRLQVAIRLNHALGGGVDLSPATSPQ